MKVRISIAAYSINANKDTFIVHETESVIKIKAGTIVDKNGEPVKGEVELTYVLVFEKVQDAIEQIKSMLNY